MSAIYESKYGNGYNIYQIGTTGAKTPGFNLLSSA